MNLICSFCAYFGDIDSAAKIVVINEHSACPDRARREQRSDH